MKPETLSTNGETGFGFGFGFDDLMRGARYDRLPAWYESARRRPTDPSRREPPAAPAPDAPTRRKEPELDIAEAA